MFDRRRWFLIPKSARVNSHSAAHRELARKLANESMVLLKNDGVLPLKKSGTRIAVVGPLADQTRVLLGNYNGIPTHTVSILEGLRKEFAGATINYVPGTQFLAQHAVPVPASALSTDSKPGVKVSYAHLDMTNMNRPGDLRTHRDEDPVEHQLRQRAISCRSRWGEREAARSHLEATLTASETGEYNPESARQQ